MTAPQLLAIALRQPCPAGREACFYCGGACGSDFLAANHLSNTFTAWNQVARPNSPYLCGGCVLATREAVSLAGHEKPQRMRTYSWVICEAGAAHHTKANLAALRTACLTPPTPPFAIILSASGQKHLIYLAPVNRSAEIVTVQFELSRVTFRPAELAARLTLCARLCAATGKPALAEAPTASLAVRLAVYYRDFEPLLSWYDLWDAPLSRLAAWLTDGKESCQHEHPSDFAGDEPAPAPADVRRGGVPVETRGTDGPGLFG